MRWPPLQELERELSLPDVTLRPLTTDDFETLPRLILEWYPAVAVGAESVFCDPAFLRARIAREGHEADVFAFLVERGGATVAFMSFQREVASKTLHARLGVLAPEARVGFLGAAGFLVFETLGRRVGAELLLVWVTLASRHQQIAARRRGFRLSGVVPGFDRDLVEDGRALRVTEALYSKLLVPGSETRAPDPAALTRDVRELLALLEGAHE
jgi:hypothetical protein